MSLLRVGFLVRPIPADVVHKQKVKIKPIEHHYENDGEEPYVKYSCRLCEQLAEKMELFGLNDYGNFSKFSFSEGTPNCPCCGINIDWDYKVKEKNYDKCK